jgi:hypothetical protein
MTVRTPNDGVTEMDGALVATIIDCAPDGIMIVDAGGRMIHVNRRVGEI